MSRGWDPSLWQDTFQELLSDESVLDYADPWTLNFNYTLTKENKKGWKIYCHSAFGQFQCSSCRKTWPSAKTSVLFHYRLRNDRGTVIMRPFGQACRSCKANQYELPGFSRKEVEKALLRLFAKIRKNCYGEEDDDDHSERSPKVFTKPHEKTLCEACQQGICCQDDE